MVKSLMLKMYRVLTVFLIFIFSCNFSDQQEINMISTSDLINFKEKDYTLLDVRTADEFKVGYIPDAINIDYYSNSFNKNLLSFEKNSKIIIYCRTNNRSVKTANILLDNGYTDIYVIEGGITSWLDNRNIIKSIDDHID